MFVGRRQWIDRSPSSVPKCPGQGQWDEGRALAEPRLVYRSLVFNTFSPGLFLIIKITINYLCRNFLSWPPSWSRNIWIWILFEKASFLIQRQFLQRERSVVFSNCRVLGESFFRVYSALPRYVRRFPLIGVSWSGGVLAGILKRHHQIFIN